MTFLNATIFRSSTLVWLFYFALLLSALILVKNV